MTAVSPHIAADVLQHARPISARLLRRLELAAPNLSNARGCCDGVGSSLVVSRTASPALHAPHTHTHTHSILQQVHYSPVAFAIACIRAHRRVADAREHLLGFRV